jgi:hypothetical protein
MIDDFPPGISANEYGFLSCDHSDTTAIRRMIQRNNVAIVCRQCLTCGANLGAVAKGSPEVLKLATIDPFDETIGDDWRMQCDLYREEKQERERYKRHLIYSAYINSEAWKKKRAIVLDRAGDMCEGCGVSRAVHVHHLTYDHLGDELLWELKAVCRRCHQKVHPDKDL